MNKKLKLIVFLCILSSGLYCPAHGQETTRVEQHPPRRENSASGVSLDNFVFRLGYAYGPEYLFILFPPVKLGIEYHLPNRNVYMGLDASLNGLAALWIQSGVYIGLKHERLTLETKVNHLLAVGPDKETTKVWSLNPKIGIDYRQFYIKIGPYFPVHSYGSKELDESPYISVGGVLLNLDIGFRLPLNKKQTSRR